MWCDIERAWVIEYLSLQIGVLFGRRSARKRSDCTTVAGVIRSRLFTSVRPSIRATRHRKKHESWLGANLPSILDEDYRN